VARGVVGLEAAERVAVAMAVAVRVVALGALLYIHVRHEIEVPEQIGIARSS